MMGWLRYPRAPLELLIAGTAMLAATVVLFSIMYALYAAAGAFATAGGVVAIILTWELAVERPRRQARVAQALATPGRSPEDIPLQTQTGPADRSEKLPGPLGGLVRTAPATLAALLIVAVALGINGLLGDFITSDRDGGVYVLLKDGAAGDIMREGDRTRVLRVSLLTTVDEAEQRDPSLTPAPGKKLWAVEVKVVNVGTLDVVAPAWRLRDSSGKEHDLTPTGGLGENLGEDFSLPRTATRTGWVVFEIDRDAEPEWLRARISGYPTLYFATRALYEENTSPWDRPGEWR